MTLQVVEPQEPVESPEHVHLYMPARLRKRLQDEAKAQRRSESQMGCILIEGALDELTERARWIDK